MIFGNIKDAVRYKNIVKNASKAFEFVSDALENGMENGRYDIDGSKIYAIVSEYDTKSREECRLESHKRYIDLQFVLDGEEIIGVTHRDGLTVSEKYSCERDVEFYEPAKTSDVLLKKGDFVLLFPEDAHAPAISLNTPCKVKKIVVKIEI